MQYMTTASSINEHTSDPLWKQTPYATPVYSTSSSSDITDDVEKNTHGKPPYSYATLIKYAIERSAENKLTLSQIYQWVIDHYPYYGTAGSGWKVKKKKGR